jgi:hypothetical protein
VEQLSCISKFVRLQICTMSAVEEPPQKGEKDMNTSLEMQSVAGWVQRYMTSKDVCELFTEEIHSLHLLSFLLTTDQAKAKECLIAVLGDGDQEIRDFLDWVSFSARSAILRHAIRMIQPNALGMAYQSSTTLNRPSPSDRNNPFAAIAYLGTFERFVFVISVLERRPDDECATLLGCTRREVVIGRELAQRILETSGFEFGQTEETEYPLVANSVLDQRCSIC